ncbi:DUF2460 domain-containing protein [Sphingomonas arenae]|uniref:DUF2460 domain-containing protein n=1 Tax=Sphingomonas arenae TaxID=2812555 RepID=UPI00196721DF|nr:DUF2460 domain-containing protein [Sphingomonas arenae]
MKHWFTRADAPLDRTWVKRFDPRHWVVDFPRGAMASVVAGEDAHSIVAHASFLRRGDLVGLIFESEDRHAHPAHRRELKRDYSHCTLSFEWESTGVAPLDAVNGPTLTIEGRDAEGQARSWYVRLWNYAQGGGTAATIRLDFDQLDGGFSLPNDADRVFPGDIDRMFISLVPPGYEGGSEVRFQQPIEARLALRNIRCEGSGSVLAINDAMVPEHELRICTAYDDMYHLPPERVVDSIERLGFRKLITHYVGMSHYFALGGDGLVSVARAMNGPALAWHEAFAREAQRRGYGVIWSLSYEILDMFCPDDWKQRDWAGRAAATGYQPPSTLVSPASVEAIGYLKTVAQSLARVAQRAGMPVRVQVGEPWWWVTPDHEICCYDPAARAAWGANAVHIPDVRGPKSETECAFLDRAGALLAQSTATIAAGVKQVDAEASTLLLTYLPGSLSRDAPELRRANLPLGWGRPAFDVLQLEDYEWVTAGRRTKRRSEVERAAARLGYSPGEQHYLSGFVARPEDREQWSEVLIAAEDARRRGVAEVFLWAFPQVVRDGLTIFGKDDDVQAFDDVLFPIEIGAEASVAPQFSTAVVTSASGHEYRNVNWSQAKLRFDAGPGVRGDAEMQTLLAFFRARRGSAIGFRFRDPYDFSSSGMTDEAGPEDQLLGLGDGAKVRFPLVKSYGGGESRRITRPSPGSVRVSVDRQELVTDWSLDQAGIIQFDSPPPAGAEVRAGFLFDVPVRFAEDRLEINRASFRAGEAASVPLVEVREG